MYSSLPISLLIWHMICLIINYEGDQIISQVSDHTIQRDVTEKHHRVLPPSALVRP